MSHTPPPNCRFAFCMLVCSVFASGLLADTASETFFETQVRPLLADHCLSCHGEGKQESDLRLDDRNSILAGGSSGEPAAVEGQPTSSLLLQYVRHEVEGMEMPPEKPRLSGSEIATLEKWVQAGLPWPSDAVAVETIEDRVVQHRQKHWAFQKPTVAEVDLPTKWESWPQAEMDRYVLRKLLDNGMTPAKPADDHTLLRRLKFDLVGLPPTVGEVHKFESERYEQRNAEWIRRFLASPNHGEHWARHWLDVARYADTRGYAFARDRNYPWAYTYRDYVIRSLNEDLPFDQFVLEQLAADLLPMIGADNRSLAALGFLTVGRKFNNPHDDIDDKIDVVTRGFLGLTVACARCHDHKYDAIPTEDYYSLYGVFNSSEESGNPLIGEAQVLESARDYENRFNAVNGKLQTFESKVETTIRDDAHKKIGGYLDAAVRESRWYTRFAPRPRNERDQRQLRKPLIEAWTSFLRKRAKENDPVLMPWARLSSTKPETFSAAAQDLADVLSRGKHGPLNPYVKKAFADNPPTDPLEMARLYGDILSQAYQTWQAAGGNAGAQAKQSTDVRQLLWYFSDFNSPAMINRERVLKYASLEERAQRKELKAEVQQVEKTKPKSFDRAMVMRDKTKPVKAHVFVRGQAGRRGAAVPRRAPVILAGKSRLPFEVGSGRLELAQAIISKQNPLTARVFVNRVWMHYFGRPLVESPSDFGIRSDPPPQQPLLDYLAAEFMRHDWSIKWLHHEIASSATYQQSSSHRPECYAGDPENTLLWRMNRKRLGFEATRDAMLCVTEKLDSKMYGESQRMFRDLLASPRRTVYGYIDRQDLPNLLRVYDFASPDQSSEKRSSTTVPQQALFLLNSPFVQGLAKEVAKRSSGSGESRQIANLAYRRVLQRKPTAEELDVAIRLLESFGDPTSGHARLLQVLMLTNEFVYVD